MARSAKCCFASMKTWIWIPQYPPIKTSGPAVYALERQRQKDTWNWLSASLAEPMDSRFQAVTLSQKIRWRVIKTSDFDLWTLLAHTYMHKPGQTFHTQIKNKAAHRVTPTPSGVLKSYNSLSVPTAPYRCVLLEIKFILGRCCNTEPHPSPALPFVWQLPAELGSHRCSLLTPSL